MAEVPQELTQDKIEKFLYELRSIGLYENRVTRMSARDESDDELLDLMPRPSVCETLIIDLHVGDIAFMPRTQSPEQAAVDTQFESLARQFDEQEADAIRSEIADKLARGLDPFDEDDDADD